MRQYAVRTVLPAGVAAGLALTAPSAAAQHAPPASWRLEVAPYAGYMIFGKYLEGPLGTSISNAGGAVYGAQLGVRVSPYLALIGNVGHADADLRVGAPFLGGLSVGSSSVWIYDGGVQLGLPARAGGGGAIPVAPFIQAGAGALHHTVTAAFLETKASNFAAAIGVGADLIVGRDIGVRLLARDYIGRFDFQEATMLPVEGKLAHNVALSAGVKVSF